MFKRMFPGGRKSVLVFSLCWLAYAGAYFCRVNIAVALPSIASDLSLNEAQAGFIGASFFWIYAFGQLINGHIGDRFNPVKIVFIGLFCSALLNLLFGLSASFTAMIIIWGLNGYFQSMLWGPIMRTVSTTSTDSNRNFIATGMILSTVAGYMFAWFVLGKISDAFSWTLAFVLPAAIVLTFSLIWIINFRKLSIIRDDSAKVIDIKPNTQPLHQSHLLDSTHISAASKSIYNTGFIFILLACVAQGVIKDGIALWMPMFLLKEYGLTLSASVGYAMIIPFANLIGIILAGYLNSIIRNEKLLVILLYSTASFSCIVLLIFADKGILINLIMLAIISGLINGVNNIMLSILPLKYSKFGKTSSIAGTLDFCSYFGAGISGIAVGSIFTVSVHSWSGVFTLWLIAALVGTTFMFLSLIKSRKSVSESIISFDKSL